MKKQAFLFYPFLFGLLLLLFAGGLVYGAVSIPLESVVKILSGEGTERLAWQNIVLQSRLPQAVTALLAGASLAVSGLLLQTLFRNPLAGPSILGISDGANLGVAAIMLYFVEHGLGFADQRLFSCYLGGIWRGGLYFRLDCLFLGKGEE